MRWARRYAKSRTISFLVQWIVIVVMVLVIGVASSLTSLAYEQGYTLLLTLSMALMAGTMGVLTWFSVSPWGSEIIWKITNWRATPLWLTALGGGLVVYHLLLAMLVSFRFIPVAHMQPASALYMAPFLIIMIRYQDLGFWAWIWPVMYALHGVLLLAGVLSPLRGDLQLLNMIGPVFGYGLVAIVVGHAYSRYALYQLKKLARTGLPPESGSQGDGEGD
jgi:hypothetical protein